MIELRTEIRIDADPRTVWMVLTDFESYPLWNPLIHDLAGLVEHGRRLSGTLHITGEREREVTLCVASVAPGRWLRWRERTLAPGLLVSDQYFRLSESPSEAPGTPGTLLVHGMQFNGLVTAVAGTALRAQAMRRIEQFNQALKQRAERLARPDGHHSLRRVA